MTYLPLSSHGDIKKMQMRYTMAKWLSTVSLLAVVLMATYAVLYPSVRHNKMHPKVTDEHLDPYRGAAADASSGDRPHGRVTTQIRNSTCRFTADNMIFPSDASGYTPPNPDDTLREVLNYVSDKDFNGYCDMWDPVHGFSADLQVYNDDCGPWQMQYQKQQEQRLQQLAHLKAGTLKSPEDIPRFASYICQEDPHHRGSRGCGGLADRFIGIVSTFFYAMMTDRGFLMNWQEGNPAALESIFEKPRIDWTFNPDDMRDLYRKPGRGYHTVDMLNFNWDRTRNTMFPDGPSQDFNQLWPEPYVEVKSNRGYVIRTFDYSDHYEEKLKKMGLSKTNHWRCIVDYLVHPKLEARRFINAYKQLFQMDSVLSIGLQIRTDDTAMANPAADTNSFEQWDYFLSCANKLRDAQRGPQHKRVVYFLLTDSTKLREQFVAMNYNKELRDTYIKDDDTSMVVTGLPIEHIEAKTVKTKFEVNITDSDSDAQKLLAGVNSAVIDNWLLSYTDYRLISRQGFGKIAAFHANNPRSTISLPRLENKDHVVNCASPHAFTAFETLSTWWSLG
ncbi:hypothetical protein BC940DRAFT_299512 [Gongronella butleri]|nr:hypothetical protein BC940DRAFT_299512 [Gongronella butleri]